MSSLSVILPTYNEAENVLPLIDEIPALPEIKEILVVDDDSPDRTWEVASQNPRVRVIRRIGERGLISALNRGIAEANGELVTWLDSDGSMPPGMIPTLLILNKNADIVIGSRYVPGGHDSRRSYLRRLTSRIINGLAVCMLHTQVRDCTTGYVLAERKWLLQHPLEGYYGDYCIRLLIQAERAGLTIAEVGFENVERSKGLSKTEESMFSFCKLGLAYLKTIWQLRP
jgi:dolichol-phosphate mannosyltransferase